jgi:hypothetical protein
MNVNNRREISDIAYDDGMRALDEKFKNKFVDSHRRLKAKIH